MVDTIVYPVPVLIDGVPFLQVGDQVLPWPGESNGGGNGGNGSLPIPDFKVIPILWKQKGTSNHPSIGNGVIQATAFVLGHFAHIDVKVHFGSDTGLGGSIDPKDFWYFQFEDNLMPDFKDAKTVEGVSAFHAYTSVGMMDGTCYWTKNVGSGIDGVKLSADMAKDIGPSTFAWHKASKQDGTPDGDSLRFSISYRRASNST